jgi:hypothetical protein
MTIPNYSTQELMAARQLKGIPPAQMSGKVMDLLGKDPSMSLSRLLALKQESDRIDQQQQVQQAMLMAQQGGQQMPQMPQMPPQGMPQQGMPPQGMPQGAPQQAPTVAQELEQKVAASAAEPMRQGGIAGLPIDNFQPSNYANGGIIAFGAGAGGNGNDGPIKAPTYEEIVEDDDLASINSAGLTPAFAGRGATPAGMQARFDSPQAAVESFRASMAPYRVQTEESKARAEEIKQAKADLVKQNEQDKYANILLAGLGIAGGTSPYFAANLSNAAPAVKNYMQNQRESKKQNLEYSKELAGIAQAQRAEGIEDVKGGYDIYGKQLTRDIQLAQANKPSAMKEYSNQYFDNAVRKGDTRPESEIRQEAIEKYTTLTALPRIEAQERIARMTSAPANTNASTNIQEIQEKERKNLHDQAMKLIAGNPIAAIKFDKLPMKEKAQKLQDAINIIQSIGSPGATGTSSQKASSKQKASKGMTAAEARAAGFPIPD